jgi:hypothetical protein
MDRQVTDVPSRKLERADDEAVRRDRDLLSGSSHHGGVPENREHLVSESREEPLAQESSAELSPGTMA